MNLSDEPRLYPNEPAMPLSSGANIATKRQPSSQALIKFNISDIGNTPLFQLHKSKGQQGLIQTCQL